MSTIIDTHSHIHFPQYDLDRDEVVIRARAAGVATIAIGTNLETSQLAVRIAERYPGDILGVTAGLHPTHEEDFDVGEFQKLMAHPSVLAIGECGLDYYRITDPKLHVHQREVLVTHINCARDLKKPLIIHCRQAFPDLIQILSEHRDALLLKRAGIVHFFSGSWADAEALLELGFYLGFGGVVTFTRDYDEVIKKSPKERIVVETDAPFVAPEPYRGRRNESSYIVETVKKLAELRFLSYEEIAETTTENARKVFGLEYS